MGHARQTGMLPAPRHAALDKCQPPLFAFSFSLAVVTSTVGTSIFFSVVVTLGTLTVASLLPTFTSGVVTSYLGSVTSPSCFFVTSYLGTVTLPSCVFFTSQPV